MERAFVVWFFGGEDAARHALARGVAAELMDRSIPCEVPIDTLPERVTAEGLPYVLGFCRALSRNGVVVLGSAAGLDHIAREKLREEVGSVVLVRSGPPDPNVPDGAVEPEVVCDLQAEEEQDIIDHVMATLEILERVPSAPGGPYTPEEEDRIKRRLRDLGYI